MRPAFAQAALAMVADTEHRFHFMIRERTGELYWKREGEDFLGIQTGQEIPDAKAFFRDRLRSGDTLLAFSEGLRMLRKTGSMSCIPIRLQTGNGREEALLLSCETVTDQRTGERYLAGCLAGAKALEAVQPATGLCGTDRLRTDLAHWQMARQPMSYLLIGIANLSEITSCYQSGFETDLLHQIGILLHDFSNTHGFLLYHTKGAHFVLAGKALCAENLNAAFCLIQKRLRQGIRRDAVTVYPEIRGAALVPEDFPQDENTLIHALETALLRTGVGESLVRCSREELEKDRMRILLVRELRRDIAQGFRGFSVVFQPIVDARTGKYIAAETLTRWKSSRFGEVSPGLFIPLLEEDPVFPALGRWITMTALSEGRILDRAYPGILLHVNVSPVQLAGENFAEELLEAVQAAGFPKEQLCLELTERCRILDPDLLSRTLRKLRDEGMKIALDDFGTGFSSLGILRKIPADVIKTDRSFILDIENSKRDQEMIRSIVSLAAGFGQKVCTEGVETESVRNLLCSLGVGELQGYLFGRPCAALELAAKKQKISVAICGSPRRISSGKRKTSKRRSRQQGADHAGKQDKTGTCACDDGGVAPKAYPHLHGSGPSGTARSADLQHG